MFFRFGMQKKSALELLLDTEGMEVAVEMVLNIDDILQNLRTQSGKLVEYLNRKDHMQTLLQYALAEPIEIPFEDRDDFEEGEEDRREHKYPQVATEILCADIEQLYTFIVEDVDLMQQLFFTVFSDSITNNVRGANWIQIMTMILQRKPLEMLRYMTTLDQDFVSAMMNHMDIPGLDELMLKLMCCDSLVSKDDGPFSMTTTQNNPYRIKIFEALQMFGQQQHRGEHIRLQPNDIDFSATTNWWISNDVVTKLIGKLDPALDDDVHSNVCNVLCEVLQRSVQARSIAHADHPIASVLLTSEIIERLIDRIMENSHSSLLQQGVSLWSTLVETSFEAENDDEETLSASIDVILSRLPVLIKILENPPKMEPIELTVGVLDQPLGETRLKIVEFLGSLFHLQSTRVDKELINSNALGVIIDLFFRYEFNNMLHNQVLHIIGFILSGSSQEMKKELFVKENITQRIAAANKANEHVIGQPKGMRKGYMGHVIAISNAITSTEKADPNVAEMISDHEGAEAWRKFVNSALAERNAMEAVILGGKNPDNLDFGTYFQDFEMQNDQEGEEDEDEVYQQEPPVSDMQDIDIGPSSESDSDSDNDENGEDIRPDSVDNDSRDETDTASPGDENQVNEEEQTMQYENQESDNNDDGDDAHVRSEGEESSEQS